MNQMPLFVAYYTAGSEYEFEAINLRASLDALKLRHDIHELSSHGDWQANTQLKSRFIRDMMDLHGGAIVYLDVDAYVIKTPVLFGELNCDIAAHHFGGHTLLSGTIYFGPNPTSRQIVDRWMDLCRKYPVSFPAGAIRRYPAGEAAWDQRLLEAAIDDVPEARFVELPCEYTYMVGQSQVEYPERNPVILHTNGGWRIRDRVKKAG